MDIRTFRVSPDGKYLEVWVEISAYIEGQDYNILQIAISSHQNFKYVESLDQFNPDDFEYYLIPENPKRIVKRIDLDVNTIIQRTGLYYLYIFTDRPSASSIQEECCCNCNAIELAVAIDLMPIYNIAVRHFENINCNRCDTDSSEDDIIDVYLKKTMLLQAISLEDFGTANEIWENLLRDDILRGDCMNSVYGFNRRYLPKYADYYNNCSECN